MRSAQLNVTPVTSLTLDGLALLSDHTLLFFFFFLAVYMFVVFSDSLVVYLICTRRKLRRPMFAFVAAVLLNSLAGSVAVYPKLLSDVLSGRGFAQVSRSSCLCQAFVVFSLGGSSFMLLSAMAFDRYLSICRPLRYAALVSPAAVAALLLLCWLLPAGLVGGAVLLASRLPLCRSRLSRIYCDVYSFVRLSCGGGAALLSEVYGLLCSVVIVFLPAVFVLFSYGKILSICLRRSRAFSSKALHTCLPHLLVFINYSLSTAFELLHRQLQARGEPAASTLCSVLILVVPTVMNPVVYGLKMKEIFIHLKQLLSCQRAA
ncbi:olfactory receptor 11A1-like [Chelmon rostratus]|uniref:olfactory receptor 11A1-like n=1 Tax=Chelmon rostratus TaxID=109905 RepID=UPI001BE667A2|nr:olfactory receptor 11A1-like [Chelmon rostratus]